MRFSRLAIFSVAIALTGCLFVCSQASAGNAATQSAAHLLSYVVEENVPDSGVRYHWKFWDPDTGKQQTFLDLPDKPKLVIWDTQERLVYYSIGSRIFDAPYPRTYALATQVGDLPPGDATVMWLERTTGRLRVIVREEIPDSAIIRKPDDKVVFRLADGSTVSGTDLPDWGVAAVLTVLELGPRGKWALLARRATKDGDPDTPGLDEVEDLWHERGVSQHALLASYTLPNPHPHHRMDLEEVSKSLAERLRIDGYHGGKHFLYLRLPGSPNGIVFYEGDSDFLFLETPIFLLSRDGKQLKRLDLGNRRFVGLGKSGIYLLIADAGNGDNPIVIDLNTGGTVFSPENAHDAMWIP